MDVDKTWETQLDLAVPEYDTARFPLPIPSDQPADEPQVVRSLNASWWPLVRGMTGRLLYADSWQGVETVQADGVQAALKCIDRLQQEPTNVLQQWTWDWQGSDGSPAPPLTILTGHYDVGNQKLREDLLSGTTYRILVQMPGSYLINRVEIDTSWASVSGCTASNIHCYFNAVNQRIDTLACSGAYTFFWQGTGATIEEQLKWATGIYFWQDLTVINAGLPFRIEWTGIRVFGYGTKFE